MTNAADPIAHAPLIARRRDRRQAFFDVLGGLARSLRRGGEVATVRTEFEKLVRRLVAARAVQLRDGAARWSSSSPAPVAGSVSLDIPGPHGAPVGVLQSTFDRSTTASDWDLQMLAAAADLGALVLEIERSWTQLARAGLFADSPRKRDAAPLIGSTPVMRALRSTIERLAGTDFTVLIEGESGVGKELVARQIHELSRRRNGPFVAINCAALVETLLEAELFGIEDRTATGVRGRRGKFEYADGGTLFLDEVSDLSPSAQAKLLRAIQDLAIQRVGGHGTHRVDIRIIAATNRRLSELVDRQLFRTDLFYRLSGVDVLVPTLRERRADIIELARYFLDRHRARRPLRLSTGASDALVAYDWPGNVRELERVIERTVTLAESDVIEVSDLPPTIRHEYAAALGPSLARNETMRAWGSRYARLVLERCDGNKRQTSRVLGISYHTLQAYLRYPLDQPAEETWRPQAVADA